MVCCDCDRDAFVHLKVLNRIELPSTFIPLNNSTYGQDKASLKVFCI